MAQTIRMVDIAKKLGISVVSVSKGLSGKDGVSEKTRKQILETAREMGYEMPGSGNSEKNGTKIIGVLAEEHFLAEGQSFDKDSFYFSLYKELLTIGAPRGFTLLMEIVTPDMIRENRLPNVMTTHKADGLIFLGEISRSYIRAVTKPEIPFIFLDFYDDDYPAHCVLSNNTHGGYKMTRYLLDAGLKKIGFIGSVRATSSIMDRYIGYTKALLQESIYPRKDWLLEDRDNEGRYIDLKLPAEMPEAFVCSSDEVAFHLIEKLTKAGYRVPQDISVTGYDDYRYAELSDPQLTTYRVNTKGMANAALAAMQSLMEHGSDFSYSVVIPGEDVVRKSIRAAKK